MTSPSSDAGSLQSKITELEAEVMQLREQLGKAKSVNDVMWETVVQKVLIPDKQNEKEMRGENSESMEVDEVAKRRKKNRI